MVQLFQEPESSPAKRMPWLQPLAPPEAANARLHFLRPPYRSGRPSAGRHLPRTASLDSLGPSRASLLHDHARPPPLPGTQAYHSSAAGPYGHFSAELEAKVVHDPIFGAIGKKPAVPRAPTKPQSHLSDRESVALVDAELTRRLEEAGDGSFRQVLEAHAEAFEAVAHQVSQHCDERGALVERLRAFYARSSDVIVRQATNAAHSELAQQIEMLQVRSGRVEPARVRSNQS